jgi:Protein of unknown function (DUF2934)
MFLLRKRRESVIKIGIFREEPQMSTGESFDIAARAYAIWERAGCPHGTALDNWLQAEAEISQKMQQRPKIETAVSEKGRKKARA